MPRRAPNSSGRVTMTGIMRNLVLTAALLGGSAMADEWTPAPDAAPELIVHNALVTTLDAARADASAVAVGEGLFQSVGTDAEILALAGPGTRVIDGGGRRLIPGLNDSHSHFIRGGRFYNTELRWDGVPSLELALDRVRTQAERTPNGQWVRVIGGWSPFQFAERRMPTPEELTAAAPDTPVFVLYLYSRGFLNQAGLDALGITPENAAEKAPAGGRYEVVDGRLTGRLLAEPNPTILYRTIGALPGLSADDQVNSSRQFFRELNRLGLTSAVDAGGGGHRFPDDYLGSRRLAEAGEMPLRISYYLFPQNPGGELAEFRGYMAENRPGNDMAEKLLHGLELEGAGEFLVWAAGDFENFTAPRPDITSRSNWRKQLHGVTTELVSRGWPLRIHATYDPSVGHILDVFEAVDAEQKAAGAAGFDGIRWAFDHGETVSRQNLERIRALGGGFAIQGRMPFAGEYFVERYGAEAAASAPPLRDMLELGLPLGAGTDATRVSSFNPWVTIEWLVTGRSVGGMQLLNERHRLSREEALGLFTVGSAWFSQEEDKKGRIRAGQLADFALLTEDYFAVADDAIDGLASVLTVTGGQIVYAAAEYADSNPPLPPVSPDWSPVSVFGGYYQDSQMP